MRSRVLYLVALMLLLTTTSLYSQKDGATPLAGSAMDHLYPRPAQWSGAKYTTPPSTIDRFYLTYGIEYYGVRHHNTGEDFNGWMNRLGVGYSLSPVHSLEFGASLNSWDKSDLFCRFDAAYLFNVTAFANRTEQPAKWELFTKFGVESYVGMANDDVTFGASAAFRAKYNISQLVGLYIEPKLAFAGGGGDFSTSLENNIFIPSVSFGVTVNVGQMRDKIKGAIDYRNELWGNSDYSFKPLLAIKTNLLYDVLTLTNIEIEFPVMQNWSIAAEWVFPWWSSGDDESSKRNCVQLLNGNAEVKYWFGDRTNRPVMTGWHVGLYAGGGLYDLEHNKIGYQGEFFIAAGLSGGYAHTINQRGNLRMEYSVAVGYLQTNYEKYTDQWAIDNKWYLVSEEKGVYSWFGPTRVKASLVWMLNRKVIRRN